MSEDKKPEDANEACSIPFDAKMMEALKDVVMIRGDKHVISFDPNVPGRTITREEEEAELREFAAKVTATDEIEKYRDDCGERYVEPKGVSQGYTTTDILPELIGCPLCNLVLGYVHAFHPTAIRISTGCVTCDSQHGRVTIFVDEQNKVRRVFQEITVLYNCGGEMGRALRALKEGKPVPTDAPRIFYKDGRTA